MRRSGGPAFWRRHSFAIVLVGNRSLLRGCVARNPTFSKFSHLSFSVIRGDDFLSSKVQPHDPLFFIVHTGDDFDVVTEQIELLRRCKPSGRIAIVVDRYRQEEVASAFRAGANGFFVEVMTSNVFVKSIELVMMGETVPWVCHSFSVPKATAWTLMAQDATRGAHRHATGRDCTQLSPREKNSALSG